jgi:hypothetical protein
MANNIAAIIAAIHLLFIALLLLFKINIHSTNGVILSYLKKSYERRITLVGIFILKPPYVWQFHALRVYVFLTDDAQPLPICLVIHRLIERMPY